MEEALTVSLPAYGLAVMGVALLLAGFRLASLEREVRLKREENGRLWNLIGSMRSVVIEPQAVQQAVAVTTELSRETPTSPLRETPDGPGFRRYTDRETFYEDEEQ